MTKIITMIKTIEEEIENEIEYMNKREENGLALDEKEFIKAIFRSNIKYVKNHMQSITRSDLQMESVVTAIGFSNNIELIDFLIDRFKINVTDGLIIGSIVNKGKYTAHWDTVSYLIEHNRNPHVIKHVIEKYKLDVHDTKFDDYESNYNPFLPIVCQRIGSMNIVKYLVEEKQINVNQKCVEESIERSLYSLRRLPVVLPERFSEKNERCEIIAYLLAIAQKDATSESLKYCELSEQKLVFMHMLSMDQINPHTYYKNLNSLLGMMIDSVDDKKNSRKYYSSDGLEIFSVSEIIKIIQEVSSPLIIDEKYHSIFKIEPCGCNGNFDEYMKSVDRIQCIIQLSHRKNNNRSTHTHPTYCPDFTRSQDIFKCGGEIYRGDRKIVYVTMLFLRDLLDDCDFNESIELSVSLPKYAVNQYINASFTGSFDLKTIDPRDFIQFLKFIHQYPTTVISIEQLEYQIIDYFESNKLNYNDYQYLKDMVKQYKLYDIYLDARNKQIIRDYESISSS